ncbi:MAG: hypothetical protein ACXWQ5_20660 [Ktedonobacterales bacterium]
MVIRALKRWVSQVRYHQWSLVAMSITYLFAQFCTLAQTPITAINNDSQSYVHVADNFAHSFLPSFVEPFRTPGYPLFLLLVKRVTGTSFANMYCQPTYPNIAACNQAFIPFVFAQAVVYGITVLEVYVLAYWLTRKRWMATVATIVASCNLYMYSWEREIGTELLSMWAIVTVLLIFVRYVRRPSLWWGGRAGSMPLCVGDDPSLQRVRAYAARCFGVGACALDAGARGAARLLEERAVHVARGL